MTIYERKSAIEHILHAPDMYLGPVTRSEVFNWVMEDGQAIYCKHEYIAGLYKMFDEVLVNALDQHVRTQSTDTPVTTISCIIKDNTITVCNNGPGIDVMIHPKYKVYIPQMVFSELLTSSNFNSNEKKIVGGKNGLGVKLVFIWSSYAKIETVDPVRHLLYTQVFRNNLSIIEPPTIKSYKKKPYTSVTFTPDYNRLGIDGLDDTTIKLFERRLYDVSAITGKKVKVSFNDCIIPVNSFDKYIKLFTQAPSVHSISPRWEYLVCLSEEFTQISFVNGVYTQKGGRHVDYIVNQLVRKLIVFIQKKKKIDVKPSVIREHLCIIIHCSIENPSFDSQTKDHLTSPVASFGSTCEVTDAIIEKVAKIGILDMALQMTCQKETKQVKKNDGSKTKTISGIPKYTGANRAGTVDSHKCTLILCEGDSAKTSVMSGLSKKDRDHYGVYPMRGKTLNVRDETLTRINANKEIHELKQIMGLEVGRVYTPELILSKLRYGKILFMTDQDKDGSHIKGLGINVFDSLWPSLLKQPSFIGYMNTPIIKATKGKKEVSFYSEEKYEEWRKTATGWKVKYFKGLGTFVATEFIALFKRKEELIVQFEWSPTCNDALDRTFNKKRADHRKVWLQTCTSNHQLNNEHRVVTYTNFIDEELSKFSIYDCQRSIGHVVDGLKPSQRKILYAAFKKKLINEIKVAQFSGYISEHTAYHHGENSLNGAIVNMAQTFVGSNNLNVLSPNGQFGSRLKGGKDSASERYIFTKLCDYTRLIYPQEDDAVLDYVMDDGEAVEPLYYAPIIPMVLVNGCCGIGTGTSTLVLCYNPIELINHVLDRLSGSSNRPEFKPYYRGFKGDIIQDGDKYQSRGIYTVSGLTVHIRELPIGQWTDDYKVFLDESPLVKTFTENNTDIDVDFTVQLCAPVDDIEKSLKLVKQMSDRNMNLYDKESCLTHYSTVHDIIDSYYVARHDMYIKRKKHQIKEQEILLRKMTNRVKYIRALLSGELDLRRKSRLDIELALKALSISMHDGTFNYLIHMTMDSVSEEKVATIEKEYQVIEETLNTLRTTTVETMWRHELIALLSKI